MKYLDTPSKKPSVSICQIFVLLLLTGCGASHPSKPSAPDDRLEALQKRYGEMQAEARATRDLNGWLAGSDCDGMIWAGEYAASSCEPEIRIEAAEYLNAPGRFNRIPNEGCGPDKGNSATTWSRDMGIAGLFPYGYLCKRTDILSRHASYGKSHSWKMGEPFADGRAIYTPGMIGTLYKIIDALGGPKDIDENLPEIYPGGLTDYQAHLQVKTIFLRGLVSGSGVSDTMLTRLKEHAAEEKNDPFFAYVLGKYSGSMSPAVDLLLDPAMPMGHYVRCDDGHSCKLAHWLFTASLVIQNLKR